MDIENYGRYSGTSPYGHLGNRSSRYYGPFFLTIGDRINGVPLYMKGTFFNLTMQLAMVPESSHLQISNFHCS